MFDMEQAVSASDAKGSYMLLSQVVDVAAATPT